MISSLYQKEEGKERNHRKEVLVDREHCLKHIFFVFPVNGKKPNPSGLTGPGVVCGELNPLLCLEEIMIVS